MDWKSSSEEELSGYTERQVSYLEGICHMSVYSNNDDEDLGVFSESSLH